MKLPEIRKRNKDHLDTINSTGFSLPDSFETYTVKTSEDSNDTQSRASASQVKSVTLGTLFNNGKGFTISEDCKTVSLVKS